MENNDIEIKDANDLVSEIWSKLQTTGLYGMTQKNLYDYLLYLFNKYDSNSFLYNNTDEENERLLKTTSTKIQSAKKNIAVQFMGNTEYQKLFTDFIVGIALDKIPFSLHEDKLRVEIRDPSIKTILEARLQRLNKEGFEYSSNRAGKSIEIEVLSFTQILIEEMHNVKLEDDIKTKLTDKISNALKEFRIENVLKTSGNLVEIFKGDISKLLDFKANLIKIFKK